jgi:hypothetical protein
MVKTIFNIENDEHNTEVNARKVLLVDGKGRAVTDRFNPALITMTIEHYHIHEGNYFQASLYFTLGNSAIKYCQLKTGDKAIHLKHKELVDGTSSLLCELIENPNLTDGTVVIPIYNMNRITTKVTEVQLFDSPTSISGGTLLETDYIAGSNQSVGERRQSDEEWILKRNANYVFKLTNLSNSTNKIESKLRWYEL